jgi:hypothetical protein
MPYLRELSTVVQRNCHVSDALYARSYSLCTYLLKMREYFRWERGFPLSAALPGADVGHWVDQRERLWDSLEAEDFACLPLPSGCHEPFDTLIINDALVADGLVYGGGYGPFAKPQFFLGRLSYAEQRGDLRVYVADDEYARDMTAPPAMVQGKRIFIRLDALRRFIWQMIEEWQWHQRSGPVAYLLDFYQFERDPEGATARMARDQTEPVIQHELGEAAAGEILGEAWHSMLLALAGSRAELVARAIRDHLADSISTLPALVENGHPAALHFFFANLRGMRRALFPEAWVAYEHWSTTGDLRSLDAVVTSARERWTQSATHLLQAYGQGEGPLQQAIEALLPSASRCPVGSAG